MTGEPRYFIEALDIKHHKILEFCCGNPTLDDVIHDPSRLLNSGQSFVVVAVPGDRQILAVLTLLPGLQEVFSATAQFNAILLNILAVDARFQKRGIGKWALTRLMWYIVQKSENYSLDHLLIDPLDDSREYYEHLNFGFVHTTSGRLAMNVETMRQAVEISGESEYVNWFEAQHGDLDVPPQLGTSTS